MDLRSVALLLMVAVGCSPDDEPLAGTERPVEWQLIEAPDGEVLEVEAVFSGSSCAELRRWEVGEGARVEIEAIVFHHPVDECTGDLSAVVQTVRLEDPLGERDLVGCEPDGPGADCRVVNRLEK